MALYKDQFLLMDPANPPAVGSLVGFARYTLNDANNNGQISSGQGDTINNIGISQSWPGDTITLNVPGVGNVTYKGTTFYMSNGARYFTPTDGKVLPKNGTFVSATYVNTQGPLLITQLGPACFAAGTLIDTPSGPVAVEALAPGDLVLTRDDGPRPLLWVAREEVDGTGTAAPVRLAPGALGATRPLLVSPQHRLLLSGPAVELHFGTAEVLAPALALTALPGLVRAPQARVSYHHLLLAGHAILSAHGVWSESLHPSGAMAERLGAPRPASPVPAARPCLSASEARLLATLLPRAARAA